MEKQVRGKQQNVDVLCRVLSASLFYSLPSSLCLPWYHSHMGLLNHLEHARASSSIYGGMCYNIFLPLSTFGESPKDYQKIVPWPLYTSTSVPSPMWPQWYLINIEAITPMWLAIWFINFKQLTNLKCFINLRFHN